MAAEQEKHAPGESGGGYSYGTGGNYAGYSAAGYGYGDAGESSTIQRTFQDYLLIVRERIWYIVVVFLVVFSSALVYTLSKPKIYESTATVQIFRRDPTIMPGQQVVDTDIRSTEDLNTQVKVIESEAIIESVASRITGQELREFLAPYDTGAPEKPSVARLLKLNRRVIPQRLTLMVWIAYKHPNRFVAAKVANHFARAYIDYNTQLRISEGVKAVEDLKGPVETQRKLVERLASELQRYKEQHKMVSLDQRKDIVSESLKAINLEVARASIALNAAENRRNQVAELKARGGNLTELPFIATQATIVELLKQLAAQKVQLEQLGARYRAKFPKMIEAQNSYDQIKRELDRAIASACAQVESDYQSALNTYRQNQEELKRRTQDSLAVDHAALDYENMQRELKIQEDILTTITARRTETSMSSNIATQNARIIDLAQESPEGRPISPNVPLNLGLGVIGGLGLGLAFAFFVAFIDDRVKSSFDIEGVVGLPLIGIIPEIKKLEQVEKAQIVATNTDRLASEAFLTLHSSLRLKDESKNAKCILTTSTIPGEGKSLTTTNLALTFAAHGEKVIVVDCDLRKPNIHKSFRIENIRGVIDVCSGKATLDEVIVRNQQPNLDVLPTGGRAKNPTHILNSKAFETMIADLRKRYDRVFIDTPPLAAVSDALIILPLVDGSIFTIFFNKVRRKAAQFAAKRLLDSNVPNFGAVLNGLNLVVSGYYYAQYYDKSYKDYYVVSKGDTEQER
ncbi:polysaccharide biosynthesis tyrosine autokinase [Opitutus sp. ER46]|uniref:GumC family protein n=1 Tax=Opitutus sp. ER46 TaxID=2161864 RepID=UPI000D3234B8|nr:polysaccharide biosynthesis tyrosine autokinase [Opitutus sp. ER46]PTX91625.1 sugar tyrosine-protein kinase [Opitutus sp. ER46]